MAFTAVWAVGGSMLLSLKAVNPLVLFAVWLIGYVWGAAYIATNGRMADRLVKVWLGTLAGVAIAGVAGMILLS
jgi:hypothetical protein